MRIVSLLPSATEIICKLGLEDTLVGVSHECDFPPFVSRFPRLTRSNLRMDAESRDIDAQVTASAQTGRPLYQIDEKLLSDLAPDLIITQGLCPVCAVDLEQVRRVAARMIHPARVLPLSPNDFSGVFENIRQIGAATGTQVAAGELVQRLKARVQAVRERGRSLEYPQRICVLEWIDPPFSAGHWVAEMTEFTGGIEGFGKAGAASRRLLWQDVVGWMPEILVLASCGHSLERILEDIPVLAGFPGFWDLPATKSGRVYAVDSHNFFSRPSPRLVDGLEMLAHCLYPELHPLPPGIPRIERVDLGPAAPRGKAPGFSDRVNQPERVEVERK
ncbi:MAG: ABC transporter substrate-binding protein [Candidatus Sumerlaeia bacterium]|nr:ABC transporter substrate-binding protein [Candidatus Sumerlaeia bacterium]